MLLKWVSCVRNIFAVIFNFSSLFSIKIKISAITFSPITMTFPKKMKKGRNLAQYKNKTFKINNFDNIRFSFTGPNFYPEIKKGKKKPKTNKLNTYHFLFVFKITRDRKTCKRKCIARRGSPV